MFDYIETFPREVKYMWRDRLSLPKALFFFVRYYIFAHSMMWIAYHHDTSLSGSLCNFPFSRNAISCHVVLIACEAVSYVRVYAFSGGNKYLMVFLMLHWTAINIVTGLYLHKFLRSVVFLDLPRQARLGCFPAQAEGLDLAVNIGTLIAGVSTTTIIMMIIVLRRRRYLPARNSLLKVFYQDGIFYFIGLTILSVINIIVFLVAPNNGMKLLTIQPLVHFGALVTTRMLLHLNLQPSSIL